MLDDDFVVRLRSPIVDELTWLPAPSETARLSPNARYHWQVRAVDDDGGARSPPAPLVPLGSAGGK